MLARRIVRPGTSMRQISIGASSENVRLAQRLLNRHLRRTPGFIRLRADGAFGRRTADAVAAFQRLNHISHEDRVIGPTTWRALGVTIEIDHPVTMRAQHYDMGCWAAAAAMVLDRDMSVGTNDASLGTSFGLMPELENVERFVSQFGWSVESPPGDPRGLASILRAGPIWIAGTVIREDGSQGGHVVVISGAWGDGTPEGTYIRIHDPWSVNHGTVKSCSYPLMVVSEDLAFDPTFIAGPF